jgi:hypothetical protein
MIRRLLRFGLGVLLPALLILAGLLVLTGCIFIPGFHETVEKTNVAAKVGDASSNRPIRVGNATRAQIVAMFGPPQYVDDTGRRIGYRWTVRNGIWLVPLCFTATPRLGYHGIELDFDEHDVLERFQVVTDDPETGPSVGWSAQEMPSVGQRPPLDPALHPNRPDPLPKYIVPARPNSN